MVNNLEYIAANLSDEDILCQIAEEASELAKAALKLRRAITGTNPTPMTVKEAVDNFTEEYGDTVVAMTAYFMKHGMIDRKVRDILEQINPKYSHWAQRIKDGKKHD